MKITIKAPAPVVKEEPAPAEAKIKLRLPAIPRPKASPAVVETKTPNIKIKLGGNKAPKPQSRPLQVKRPTTIRIKPTRIPGEGYDSEDSDIEDDPLVEQAIIFRMLPDAELDYVRHCVESGDLSGITIKWKDPRRCWIQVNSTLYVGKLMRLPNIIEANKTVDKKNMFKTVDISEVLVVLKRIHDQSEINDVSPEEEEYHSGITPPMKNIVKSEYRRKLTRSRIESIEARVDELLRMDEEAVSSSYELVDPDSVGTVEEQDSHASSAHPVPPTRVIDEEESARIMFRASREKEQQANTAEAQAAEDEEIADGIDDLEMELEQALEGEELLEMDEDDDEDDDDDDDDDDDNSDDEAGMHRKVEVDEDEQHNALLRDEVSELEATIKQNQARLDKTSNALLRDRFIGSINKLEKELENKKRQLKISEDKTLTKKKQQQQHHGDESDNDETSGAGDSNRSVMGQDMDDNEEGEEEDVDMSDMEEAELETQEPQDGGNLEVDEDDFEDLFG